MKLIFAVLSLFMAVFVNTQGLFAQDKAAQVVNYTTVKSAYFAHNNIEEISHFVFSSLKEFESKVGFACAGDCREDLKTALKEEDFKKNVVVAIVYPDVPFNSKIQIQSVSTEDKKKAIIKYTFTKAEEEDTFQINAIEILSLPKKYKGNISFEKVN